MTGKVGNSPAIGETTFRNQSAQPEPPTEASPATTRVFLCGDQVLYRSAMRTLIETRPDFKVVAESGTGSAAIEESLKTDFDMAVIDFDLVGSPAADITLLESILQRVAPRQMLIISSDLEPEPCQTVMRHGVSGIVLKASGGEVLLNAIDSARRGQVWLERSVLTQMFAEDSPARRKAAIQQTKISQLTPREREIVEVACTGLTNRQIAENLTISEATVRHHLGSIFGKLGVSTRSELVVFGYRHNLARPPEPV